LRRAMVALVAVQCSLICLLQALDRTPCTTPIEAKMRDLRACGERIAAKEPDRQLLHPYWSRDDDPVRGPRHRQNRSCDLMPTGTGAVITQPRLTQQRQSSSLRMLGRRRLMILACGRIGQAEVWKWMFWPPSVALGSAWMRAERSKVPSIHLRDLYSNAYSPLGSSTSDRNPSKKRPGGRFLNACYHSVKLERAKRFELSTLTLATGPGGFRHSFHSCAKLRNSNTQQ
jgi:hypothetical protein